MKTIFFVILATVLSGCAGPQSQKFMEGFGEGLQHQAKQSQQNQYPYQAVKQARIDNQCFQQCTQAGYQYNFCTNKCSY